jgi:hypothetical protein
MASANTFNDTLNGMFKEVYADKIRDLVPDGLKLLQAVDFSAQSSQLGNLYHQPVILAMEHGITFAKSSDDAFALQAPIAGQMQDAQIRGSALVLRSVLGYNAASRSAGGKAAFMDATKYLVQNMLKSVSKKLEISMLYGQIGYGTVASTAANVVTITTAEWASGIWTGGENMPIEFRSPDGLTSRGLANITSVNINSREITVDAVPVGVIADDVIWHKGAYSNEFAGLHKIITNTGVLFNIDAGQYSLWRGNTYSAAGANLSFEKIQEAIALSVEKGLDTDVMVLVSTRTWTDLLTDQAALRMYDSSYSKQTVENGSQNIKFYGQNGMIEIVPSIHVKESYAYIFDKDDLIRVGSSDITFKRPGRGDEFFRDLENNAGYELRVYCDQALFCQAPGKMTLINNIVNAN